MSSRNYQPGKIELTDAEKFSWSEWKSTLVAVALTFLCNVESSMLSMGEWPYMTTVDHEATATFYGFASAADKVGHAVFAFVFAIWAHKISGIKIPMLVGRCITLVSCVMYILVEFIPFNRRWWMLVCYLLFGVGFATSPLLRSFIARVTSDDNRSTAYALQTGAHVLSVVVGPFAQLGFARLIYPGVFLLPPHIKFHIFTAPIWFALITNILAIAVIVFLLEDPMEEESQEIHKVESKSPMSFKSIREKLYELRTMNLPWLLILLVIFEKIFSGLFYAVAAGTGGPSMSTIYALTGQEIVLFMAISQIVVGTTALSLSIAFFMCKLGNRVSCRVLFTISNLLIFAAYALTYAYPFISKPLQPFNATTRTGCDPLEYSWCDSQLAVNLMYSMIVNMVVISFAIPASSMSLDTIYSKVIGHIDQNVMQAVVAVAGDLMSILGPIYGSAVFTSLGVNYIHIINGSVYLIGTILWLAAWKSLEPYS